MVLFVSLNFPANQQTLQQSQVHSIQFTVTVEICIGNRHGYIPAVEMALENAQVPGIGITVTVSITTVGRQITNVTANITIGIASIIVCVIKRY